MEKNFGQQDLYRVFLSSDTMRGILLEVYRHPKLECIIQMPGVRIENDFYFDMVSDSGIHATYEYAMCEKDHEYVDHLSTRISEYYDIPSSKLTVSQVHKHPPNCERFSIGDRPANVSLAKQFGGVVNGLILVNPDFKLKFWYIDETGTETSVQYIVDDKAVESVMPKKKLDALQILVEQQEAIGSFRHTGKLYENQHSTKQQKRFPKIYDKIKLISRNGQVDINHQLNQNQQSDIYQYSIRNNDFNKRKRTEKQKSALDIMSTDYDFMEEITRVSRIVDIHVQKVKENAVLLTTTDSGGKRVDFYIISNQETLYIRVGTEEKRYEQGMVVRLLKMEDSIMNKKKKILIWMSRRKRI